jgi:hypothetical protein
MTVVASSVFARSGYEANADCQAAGGLPHLVTLGIFQLV